MAAPQRRDVSAKPTLVLVYVSVAYGIILLCFWIVFRELAHSTHVDHAADTLTAFALLFAPLWFFGFDFTHAVAKVLSTPLARVLTPAVLVIPYLIYAIPRGEFHAEFLFVFVLISVGSCALLEYSPPSSKSSTITALRWQDFAVLLGLGFPIEFSWFRAAFPHPGLDTLPKLMMIDVALYAFLVVRPLQGIGYDFQPRVRDALIGIRELVFVAPVVIGLGILLDFIRPHKSMPGMIEAFGAFLLTFFLIAIPEELFFRGLLQNLMEMRLGRVWSLVSSSFIFGLSHFNKPGPFNWRYVTLASIAGIFYGRAWRDRRRILCSATTHTLVDVLWTLWFRR